MTARRKSPAFCFMEVLAMFLFVVYALFTAPVELMPREQLAVVRSVVPKVDCRETMEVLLSQDTIWYDDDSMPQSYQDPVPPITGLRLPSSVLAPPEIFEAARFKFPWGHTAGTSRCSNVRTVKFLKLPSVNGEYLLPIVYWREGLEYRWAFPRGTVAGEILLEANSSGEWYCFEIRTRTKRHDQWDVDVFRPFPRADHFARAVKDHPRLVAFANSTQTATGPFELRDEFGVFQTDGYIDVLPRMEEELVERLLTQTTFLSCHGEHWKAVDDQICHCPTSEQDFSIVPGHYDAGVIEISDRSCARCHETTSAAIGNFDSQRVLYGRIWGSDSNFSFSILNPDRSAANAEYAGPSEDLRRDFLNSGIIAPYDATVHLSDFYQQTRVVAR